MTKQHTLMDDLPFLVERQDDHLILSPRPSKHLGKHARKLFDEKKVKVRVALFSDAYFDRLSKIKVEFDDNTSLLDFFKRVQSKVVDILTR